MARRSPPFVQVTTSTTGFGPYTLTNTTPGVGYRSIANAVSDGDLVNGDQICYCIYDGTAPGNAKMFEKGIGTINTTTLVLTVASVKARSAALTSGGGWGAGTRNVLIWGLGAEDGIQIDIANEFTEDQTISKTDPAWKLKQGGVVRARLLYSANSVYLQLFSSGGLIQGSFTIGPTGTLQFSTDGSTYKDVPRLDPGNKMVQFPGGGVTKLVFYQAAAPTGWTKDTSQNDKALRIVSGSGGGAGGSRPLSSASVGSTSAPLPEHKHSMAFGVTSVVTGGGVFALVSLGSGAGLADTANAGTPPGSDSHTHDLSLAYINVIVCSLD